jgi:hypothetical protein
MLESPKLSVVAISALTLALAGGCTCAIPAGVDARDAAVRGDASRAPRVQADQCGNGVDDDANGRIDDGCPCGPGETQACFGGEVASRDVGACSDGVQVCVANGAEWGDWGDSPCEGDVPATEERCEGDDLDCDGAVDEGCPCTAGEVSACGVEFLEGECRAGEQTCRADGTWSGCDGAIGPRSEVCANGLDEDCDGDADELCGCVPEPELCRDWIDNDCDGVVDEPACEPDHPVTPPRTDAGTECASGDGAPPRLIAPMSTSRAMTLRPTLRVDTTHGESIVDLCADPACARVIESLATIDGIVRPASELERGSVVFWRARNGCGESHTWELFLTNRDRGRDTAWGAQLDIDRDGYGDIVRFNGGYPGAPRPQVYEVFRGGPDSLSEIHSTFDSMGMTFASTGERIEAALQLTAHAGGDVNGDGFGDLVGVGTDAAVARGDVGGMWGGCAVFFGSATGVVTPGVVAVSTIGPYADCLGVGDVDRDGYGDVLVATARKDRVAVHRGGPLGIDESAWWSTSATAGESLFLQAPLGDVDGDGLADFAISRVVFGGEGPGPVRVDVIRGGASAPSLHFTIHEPPRNAPAAHLAGYHGFAGTTGNGPARATSGDFDGDGLADVIVPDSRYRIDAPVDCPRCATFGRSYVYPGREHATTTIEPSVVLRTGWNSWSIGVADFDADGYDDFFWNDQLTGDDSDPPPMAMEMHYGAPEGLTEAAHVVLPMVPRAAPGTLAPYAEELAHNNIATGDFDGDGDADLVTDFGLWDLGDFSRSWTRMLVYSGGARGDYPYHSIDMTTHGGVFYGSFPGLWR